MSYDHDFEFVEFSPTSANSAIVAEKFIAVEFYELVEDEIEVVYGLRSGRVPRGLDCLPCGEISVDLSG